MIDMKQYEKKAELLKALAHPHRLCIVKGLMENNCNVTHIQNCLGLPQSTVSQHLSKLKAAGIIEGKREGSNICYSVVNKDVINIIKVLLV
ncbi:MAG TPA: winged helix-turn-helix transcriptional regulator [Clostridiaceae bacterium]|nr:winged helix-turn-helix transcriptional regulator [Clostridiaceae bacterium]